MLAEDDVVVFTDVKLSESVLKGERRDTNIIRDYLLVLLEVPYDDTVHRWALIYPYRNGVLITSGPNILYLRLDFHL